MWFFPGRARTIPLPRELYADRLKSVGVDITPEQAISLGKCAFAELREEISLLAAQIARERKLDSGDYRASPARAEAPAGAPERFWRSMRALKQIEDIIVREQIITLPQRGASIRLASEANRQPFPRLT